MITVSGRRAAVLGPASTRGWRRWDDVAALFGEPIDAEWDADRDLLDSGVADPWERR